MAESQTHPIVIIGAGIVGSSLAKHLARRGRPVTLIDRDIGTTLPGSTGHAPGFVGQLNEIATLTTLAKRSVADYKTVPGGFAPVGGLEVAYSKPAEERLSSRKHLAESYGLPSRLITSREAVDLAREFVKEDMSAALLFESDGTANPQAIALHDRAEAQRHGASLLEADVVGIQKEHGAVTGVQTSQGLIPASQVVLATGIWARQLSPSLPVHPVAHPYTHSAPRPTRSPSPFVRWPEHHVYARDHGEYDGIGSYDHPAISVDAADLGKDAYGSWEPSFDQVLSKAYSLVPSTTSFTDSKPFNGLFSTTPDNLPVAGDLGEGLFCAVAVWVTHAGGVAELLSRVIAGEKLSEEDQKLLAEISPARFEGQDEQELRRKSLRSYNDIYNTDS
ncbi:FAD dependent oxidoreductase [Papiliotrema laurentii]|uniref:FAD dependent oxidoreductase n=1 Tax=Papiliotrema laurentii TaxID=5418 RepID=A0AAD9CXI9_PAPLA|nr:FAD dependent oxidoreductase [Papiliotrema laurentii]